MFRWAIIFAVIALIASLLGFGGVAGLSKDFAIRWCIKKYAERKIGKNLIL